MKLILTLFLSILASVSNGANVLFYVPFAAKSVVLTVAPVFDQLAARGHSVTVISSWDSVKYSNNVQSVTVPSGLGSLNKELSDSALKGKNPLSNLGHFHKINAACIDANSKAIDKVLELEEKGKFDVIVTSLSLQCNEVGYYLAHRSNATLVIYGAVSTSVSIMNFATGQPSNPAYMPVIIAPFR